MIMTLGAMAKRLLVELLMRIPGNYSCILVVQQKPATLSWTLWSTGGIDFQKQNA
jgi:hypothetical protein